MKTTLNKIRFNSPCKEGWSKLLKYLGKTAADDVELDLLTILESNGLDDTLWCLRAVDGFDKEKLLIAVAFARQVQHLMTDPRSIAALDVAERFANGLATQQDLNDAYAAAAAARDAAAARAAAYAAYDAYAAAAAARAAAYAAADAADAYAAYVAAYVAYDAAYYAADAAYAARAAYDATRNKQVQILKKILEKS